MADTPDLSKIVSLIMQNPALIEQISALAKSEPTVEEAPPPVAETVSEAAETSVESHVGSRLHRQELLNAMKPYLSENRRAAIDSMMSIADILDMMRKTR